MQGCVYLLIFPNGKLYVGISRSCDVQKRVNGHYRYRKSIVARAVRKYRSELTWRILEVSSSWSELCELEKHYIQELDTLYPKGYNQSLGGEGAYGVRRTEKQREVIGRNSRERWSDPEYRERMLPKMLRNLRKANEAKRADS